MYLHDNDMDDLFRKASSEYPLGDGDSQWGNLAVSLQELRKQRRALVQKRRRRLVLGWSIGLILLCMGGYSIYEIGKADGAKEILTYKSVQKENTGKFAAGNNTLEQVNVSKAVPQVSDLKKMENTTGKVMYAGKAQKTIITGKQQYDDAESVAIQLFNAKPYTASVEEPDRRADFAAPDDIQFYKSQHQRLLQSGVGSNRNLLKAQLLPPSSGADLNHPVTPKMGSSVARSLRIPSKWYVSGFVAPQISFVHGQKVTNAGVGLGMLVGYKFDRKWSLEAGVSYQYRTFYTTGNHFRLDKIGATMPPGMQLSSVASKVDMIDIPIAFRYQIGKHQTLQPYIKTGLSASLLLREQNHYIMDVNGNKVVKDKTYTSDQVYVPATIDISAGIITQIGKGLNLQIEPFVQMPVSKIGMGSMPVTHGGLKVALSGPLGSRK